MNAQLKPTLAENGLDVRRAGRITGSRIAGILGVSPFNKRDDVMREMVREHFGASTEFVGNIATQFGEQHEPDCLDMYEQTKATITFNNQLFVIHPKHDFLAVTIDGMVEDDGLIECKCPFKSLYMKTPEYYIPQIQLQLACTGKAWCDFAVWRKDGNHFIERHLVDPDFIAKHIDTLQEFVDEFDSIINDKATASPYLQDKGRTDDLWRVAAEQWQEANAKAEAAKMELDAAKARLIELAGNASASGYNCQVIKSERKGSIKYAEAVKELLPGVDLSKYQGEASTIFTVRSAA